MKTTVYVDGFNLYYGSLKETPYKWLDLNCLSELLLHKKHHIDKIKYFTANVCQFSDDPCKPQRQQAYLRALETLPNIQIVKGFFRTRVLLLPKATFSPKQQNFKQNPELEIDSKEPVNSSVLSLSKATFSPKQQNFKQNPELEIDSKGRKVFVPVFKSEEKGSDVNLASHLVNDAHNKKFDCAVLISNDSDLKEAVRIVRAELKLKVGIVNPQPDCAFSLKEHATFKKDIRKSVLKKSQFPDNLKDSKGEFRKPALWY